MEHKRMERKPRGGLLRAALKRIGRMFRRPEPELPEDPYAWVTAPKKPRPPHRSASAVADLPEE